MALGVLPFVADELPEVVMGLADLLEPSGVLVFELQTPSQAMMTLLPHSPSATRTMLRRPGEYHVWRLLREGYQPYDPAHFARFDFVWIRPHDLSGLLGRAGLRLVDQLAVAPNFGNQPDLLRAVRRDPVAYATMLALEEETGRWLELQGAGTTRLLAATPDRD